MSEHPLPASVSAKLEQGLASMGLDAALAPPLLRYLALLHRWNGTYNLTAIRDPQAKEGNVPPADSGKAAG